MEMFLSGRSRVGGGEVERSGVETSWLANAEGGGWKRRIGQWKEGGKTVPSGGRVVQFAISKWIRVLLS